MKHLTLLDGDFGGFPVDRLTHCLQSATLAHKDGKDEEYVVCCLLHDIGDTLGTYNHADIAASILQPFVSEQNHWMIKHHAIFQGYYFLNTSASTKICAMSSKSIPTTQSLSNSSKNTMRLHLTQRQKHIP